MGFSLEAAEVRESRISDDYKTLAPTSRERQTHIRNRLVNLLCVLETDRGAIHARVLESEPHGLHTIVMTTLELTAAAELHADHAQPFLLQLVDVIDHFAHVVWVVGVLRGRAVHACAAVIDADQSHV